MRARQAIYECSACRGLVVLESQKEFVTEAAMQAYIRERLAAHVCGPRSGEPAVQLLRRA